MCDFGYVYVLWTDVFSYYGECYKIGSTVDIKKRISGYITGYPDKVEIKYITNKIEKYDTIEKIVHKKLDSYRMNKRREFFKCSLDIIKETIEEVLKISDEDIMNELLKMSKDEVIIKSGKKYKQKLKEYIQSELGEDVVISPENIRKLHKDAAKMEINRKMDFNKNISELLSDNELCISTNDKTNKKLYHCLNILKCAGFEMINDEKKIKPNFQNILKYVKDNDDDIRAAFNCKKISWPEELEKNTKQSLMMYINSKLENTIGIKINSTSKKGIYYTINKLFQL